MVEHQHAAAPPVGPDLKARPVGGERVRTARPWPVRFRQRRVLVVVAVVEDDLEHPARPVGARGGAAVTGGWPGHPVAVPDALRVAARRPGPLGAVALARQPGPHVGVVLGQVVVHGGVASVVVGLADQPAEHPGRVGRVRDAAGRGGAVERGHVARCDRSPVRLARGEVAPALDPREQALDSRPVPLDLVPPAGRGAVLGHLHPGAVAFLPERDQVLGSAQDEGVGVRVVLVPWQALVGLAGDRRNRDLPPQPERAVARTGVVAEAERRAEAGPARAGRHRDGQAGRSGGRVDGEFLPDVTDGAAALRQRHRRRSRRTAVCKLTSHGLPARSGQYALREACLVGWSPGICRNHHSSPAHGVGCTRKRGHAAPEIQSAVKDHADQAGSRLVPTGSLTDGTPGTGDMSGPDRGAGRDG